MRRTTILIVISGLIICPLIIDGAFLPSSWPEIEPIHASYHFPVAEKAKLKRTISGDDGKPIYVLECYAFPAAPGADIFNYSGDFECALHPFQAGHGYSTLLTELRYADRDWESRGRFLADQLVEPCAKYTDLGRKRAFRLRGFKLTLN